MQRKKSFSKSVVSGVVSFVRSSKSWDFRVRFLVVLCFLVH